MPVNVLRKPEPVAPSPFEHARDRWTAVNSRRRELRDRIRGCATALQVASADRDRSDPMPVRVQAIVDGYLQGRTPNVARLQRELHELTATEADAAAELAAERELWRQALASEAQRRAAELAPRHRQTVHRIASVVESLSRAIQAEREVRAGLADVGCNALPDAGLEFGTLDEYRSLLSQWNRRCLALGLLQ